MNGSPKLLLLPVLFILLLPSTGYAGIMPRTVIGLYDSASEKDIILTRLHLLAEMPLNHLGLKLEYHDISKELPDISKRDDVRGVLTWFSPGAKIDNPEEYLEWANKVVDSGRKFVIVGNPGFNANRQNKNTSLSLINNFLEKLGIKDEGTWVNYTYNISFTYKNPELLEYERKLEGFLPPFEKISLASDDATSYLVASTGDRGSINSNLVVTSPKGGYIAENYAAFIDDPDGRNEFYQWYVNPFRFFAITFDTDELPKPDTTTLAGRRIYYSQIDGDGWNSYTQIERYQKIPTLTSRVILLEAILPYPELYVTVAPIAADIDNNWVGTEESVKIMRELFALPQVEIGSHTYSHPLYWQFFEDGDIEKERPYLHLYRSGNWEDKKSSPAIYSAFKHGDSRKKPQEHDSLHGYDVPRAFANEPFNIEKEIGGSIEKINQFAPEGKKAQVIQWSGNTSPFEKALELTRLSGVKNINGGDSRFDQEYPSIAWVAPLGRQVGKELQIYASASNENTYTDLWTNKFHAFKYLRYTVDNTETPIRLKPFDIYYHMYSGEKEASLNALKENLDYASSQEIIPIPTSVFCSIVEGFFTTEINKVGSNKWKISDRGSLQTIRFDNSTFREVDFSSSEGVVGQRHHQGSLYVYLDERFKEPIISLKLTANYSEEQKSAESYLIQSNWKIAGLKRGVSEFSFITQGLSKGKMVWQVPSNGEYTVKIEGRDVTKIRTENRLLKLTIDEIHDTGPIRITITRK